MTNLQIFVTVGTDHHPFDRLVKWCDFWAKANPLDSVTIQFGTSSPPSCAVGFEYLEPVELAAEIARADVVVCHGGPATIAEIRSAGMLPIVVPRVSSVGEHVDDHQVRFTAHVSDAGMIKVPETQDELSGMLESARQDPAAFRVEAQGDQTARSVRLFGDLVDAILS